MNIILNNSSMVPIYEQLVTQIKADIISGELKPGSILPSVRALSSELRISALTVKKSYDKLEEDGFVITVHGKGSYVAETSSGFAFEALRREIEQQLDEAISKAKAAGMNNDEIHELFSILMEDYQ